MSQQQLALKPQGTSEASKNRDEMIRKGYLPDSLTLFGDTIYAGDAACWFIIFRWHSFAA